MYHNPDYKFIFLASPKTGSEAAQDYLVDLFGNKYERNYLYLSQSKKKVPNHVDLKSLIRKWNIEELNGHKVFCIMRNPYSKVVSAYHYYKQMSIKSILSSKNTSLFWKFKFILKVLFVKLFPFWVYIVFYPLKSNSAYVVDYSTGKKVDFVGLTENMEHDIHEILKSLNFKEPLPALKRKNTSSHKKWEYYFRSKVVKTCLQE